MSHIGILAHSADGAALCFLEMVRESARRMGAHRHPEITLSVLVSPLPTLDSTRLLAHAAVGVACGDAALPAWPGGPIA